MVTLECATLSAWYGSRPEIRRLLAIRDAEGLRVLVQIEPSHDSSDTFPAWMAYRHAWLDELELRMGSAVRLEPADETLDEEVERSGVIVADLSWRDPSFV